jgi:peptide/nickel transport system substrate-binding protein
MIKGKRLWVSIFPVILSLILLLLISACTSSTTSTSPSVSISPAISTSSKAPTSQAASTSSVASAPAKRLVIGTKLAGESFEILISGSQGPNTINVLGNMYEFLLAREASKTEVGKIIPGLAETYTVSPDGKMIQFTLRKNVKFHNGDPLTAADVKFSMDRLVNQKIRAGFIPSFDFYDHVEIVDDYNIRFYFSKPDSSFIPGLGIPVSSKAYYDRVGEEEFVKHPVGTGPYKITDFKTGQYVDLDAFEGYWGPAPAIKQVRFRFAPEDSTRVAMLKTGEADMITQVPYPMYSEINNTKGLKTLADSISNRTLFIKFQHVNPKTPWSDIKVRQAFAMAINLDAINKDLLYGLVKCYPVLGPGEVGYDPNLKNYEFNVTKAKALLAEAGYANGLDITYNYMGDVYGVKESAEAVGSYLNQVGFRTKIVGWEPPKWAEYNAKASNNPEMDYISQGVGNIAGTTDSVQGLVANYTMGRIYSCYFNPEVDAMIWQAKATMDDNARAELIKKAYGIVRADYEYIPLFTSARIWGMKDNLDYTPTALMAYEELLVKNIKVK